MQATRFLVTAVVVGGVIGFGALATLRSGPALPGGTIAFASYDRGTPEDRHGGELRVWRSGRVSVAYTAVGSEILESGAAWLGRDRMTFLRGLECMSCPAPDMVVVGSGGVGRGAFSIAGDPGARLSQALRRDQSRSPDGKWTVFASGSLLRVAPVRGGRARTIARCPAFCADPAWRP